MSEDEPFVRDAGDEGALERRQRKVNADLERMRRMARLRGRALLGAASIALAVALAFLFGYSLTLIPLLRAGAALGAAIGIALVADTLSIATMEVVDNAVLLLWPGAMDAGLGDLLFWGSLAIALAVAWGPTFLVNRALIKRGKGHAHAHSAHGHG